MRRLRVITPEEQRILDGGAVDKAAYTARAVFTVDSEKLLERGRLISVRAHTRFAPFPRHAHSYIEIMYMCSGKTVHRINGGEPITVHAGELLFLGRGASHEKERISLCCRSSLIRRWSASARTTRLGGSSRTASAARGARIFYCLELRMCCRCRISLKTSFGRL